ncbi:MAG: hypothetical protein ABSA13_03925 [Beijerinckiaceae bacterium]|jgi:hypothetical protein
MIELAADVQSRAHEHSHGHAHSHPEPLTLSLMAQSAGLRVVAAASFLVLLWAVIWWAVSLP